MRDDVAGAGQRQQLVAERRKARWSGAEGRRTEPAGPRPGPIGARFTSGRGFGPTRNKFYVACSC